MIFPFCLYYNEYLNIYIYIYIYIYIFFVLHKSEPARVLTDPFHVGCHLGYIDMADDTPGAKGEEFGRFPSIFFLFVLKQPYIYIYIYSQRCLSIPCIYIYIYYFLDAGTTLFL